MATKPTKPTVPDVPLRTQPSTFASRAETFVSWLASTLVNYISDALDFADTQISAAESAAAYGSAGAWLTATAYAVGDLVDQGGILYRCAIAHTSGTFATDLAAGRWEARGVDRFDVNANTLTSTAGTANTYTLTASETISAYATGQRFLVRINVANSGASTLNVDSLGAKAIKKYNAAGSKIDVEAGDLGLNEVHEVSYDGTDFVLLTLPVQDVLDRVAMVFIESQDASASATLDFTGFDATKYDAYLLVLSNLVPSADAVISLVSSTDGGASYDTGSSDYGHALINYAAGGGSSSIYGIPAAQLNISNASGVGSDTNEDGLSGTIYIHGPHLAKRTTFSVNTSFWGTTGTFTMVSGQAFRDSAADVDAVRLRVSTGTFESGVATIYGLRNS